MPKDKQLVLLRPNRKFEAFDHFLNAPTVNANTTDSFFPSAIDWYINTASTNATVAAGQGTATEAAYPGFITLQTGTNPGNSRSSMTTFPSSGFFGSVMLGAAVVELEIIFRFVPGNSTNDKEEWIGFIDSAVGSPTGTGACAYIYFDYSSNNAQWVYIAKPVGAAGSVYASGLIADSNFLRLNIRFSKSPVRATFSLNGAYIFTASDAFADNSPAGFGVVTKKYAGSASQGLDVDFVRLTYNAS